MHVYTFSFKQMTHEEEFPILVPIDFKPVNLPLVACIPNRGTKTRRACPWDLNHGNIKRKNERKAATLSDFLLLSLYPLYYIQDDVDIFLPLENTFWSNMISTNIFLVEPDSLELCILVHILPLFGRQLEGNVKSGRQTFKYQGMSSSTKQILSHKQRLLVEILDFYF